MQKFLTSLIIGVLAVFFLNGINLIFVSLELPIYLASILPLILLPEVLLKLLLFQAVPPYTSNKTTLENCSHFNVDIDKFKNYCSDLETVGFEKLIDYGVPNSKGMARLFYYPEYNCYAEVAMVEGTSVFCSIVSGFEENWFFAATNHNSSVNLRAISYVFLSLPRTMCKIFNEEPKALFESFLHWQSEVQNKLSVETIAIAGEEMYFAWERNKREMQRQRLMRKSIIISLIKMFLFSLNPKSEWMGDYPKYSNQ